MNYAKLRDYEALYARYMDKPVTELIDLAGNVEGKVVWDLCCGGGALSAECLGRGASKVISVDGCADMTSRLKATDEIVKASEQGLFRLEIADVRSYIPVSIAPSPDFVFCRQAVNYWLDKDSAKELALRMAPGSVFVFNTFNKKPSEKPLVKEYVHKDIEYVEVSWLVLPDMVHHVQIRKGMAPHTTSFRWIAPGDYWAMLGPWYDIDVKNTDATSLYRCVRK